MRVYKCDNCGKTIPEKEKDGAVTAGFGYGQYEFCKKCGEPIAQILKQYKLGSYGEEK